MPLSILVFKFIIVKRESEIYLKRKRNLCYSWYIKIFKESGTKFNPKPN